MPLFYYRMSFRFESNISHVPNKRFDLKRSEFQHYCTNPILLSFILRIANDFLIEDIGKFDYHNLDQWFLTKEWLPYLGPIL